VQAPALPFLPLSSVSYAPYLISEERPGRSVSSVPIWSGIYLFPGRRFPDTRHNRSAARTCELSKLTDLAREGKNRFMRTEKRCALVVLPVSEIKSRGYKK
jgi:hypothetical protein